MYGIARYLPYAEETQDVVDAVGIEILGHLAETRFPPDVSVFLHFVPVVGGQEPVLAQNREVIGWCSGLTVQVEIFGC